MPVLGNHPHIRPGSICINRTGWQQLILIPDGADNIIHGQLISSHPAPVHLYRHFPVNAAPDLNLRDAACLLDNIRKLVIHLGIEPRQGHIRRNRNLHNRLVIFIVLDNHRLLCLIRQLIADALHLLGGINSRLVSIRIKFQLQPHPAAFVTGRGIHSLHIGQGGKGILNRLNHLLLHGFGIGPRIADKHRNIRRIQGRQQLHPDTIKAEQPQHHKKQHNHRNADRPPNGKSCEIHAHPASCPPALSPVPASACFPAGLSAHPSAFLTVTFISFCSLS